MGKGKDNHNQDIFYERKDCFQLKEKIVFSNGVLCVHKPFLRSGPMISKRWPTQDELNNYFGGSLSHNAVKAIIIISISFIPWWSFLYYVFCFLNGISAWKRIYLCLYVFVVFYGLYLALFLLLTCFVLFLFVYFLLYSSSSSFRCFFFSNERE